MHCNREAEDRLCRALLEKTDDVYKVSWIVKGKVQATGVGMEVENA
jgi:hypothetical protein